MPAPRSLNLLKHRALVVDPSGRWTAPLKLACRELPCEIQTWHGDWERFATNPAAWEELTQTWQRPGQAPALVCYHCQPSNLEFLRFWSRAEQIVRLPPLIGLLDSIDTAAADRLRQLGCVQVHAGFHTWDRLVKTVTSLLQSPVYTGSHLEELIAANLPWSN